MRAPLLLVSLVLFAHVAPAAEPQAPPPSNTALEQRIVELERELHRIKEMLVQQRNAAGAAQPVTAPSVSKTAVPSSATASERGMDIGAELELEYVDTENDSSTAESDPHVQIDQLYLYPKYRFGDDTLLSADIAITPDKTFIEEAWFRWNRLPLRMWAEAGLNDALIANVDRKTEAEILLETAFYRNDEMGVRLGGDLAKSFYWWTTVSNGFQLATKQPSEDASFPIVQDARKTGNAAGSLFYGAGAGFRRDFSSWHLDAMPFAYRGRLDTADLTFLQAIPGYGTSFEDRKSRWGANLAAGAGPFTFIGQWLEGTDGDLDRHGWFAQPSWRLSAMSAWEVVYRYHDLRIDLPADPANSLTWDRQQHVFAVIYEMLEGVRLKTEYYVNRERTGASEVSNDEFLVQLEAIF